MRATAPSQGTPAGSQPRAWRFCPDRGPPRAQTPQEMAASSRCTETLFTQLHGRGQASSLPHAKLGGRLFPVGLSGTVVDPDLQRRCLILTAAPWSGMAGREASPGALYVRRGPLRSSAAERPPPGTCPHTPLLGREQGTLSWARTSRGGRGSVDSR